MKNKIKEIVPYAVILIIVIIIRTFIITPITVVGKSMMPTLKDSELLLLSKITYKFEDIKRFDIVVINVEEDSEKIIKRVIGLPGEYINYKDNKLYVNGKLVEETFSHELTTDFDLDSICKVEKECTYTKIPDNYYLVLGDNRINSKDSRYIGLIKKEDIQGKAIVRLYPFDRISLVK